jgi:hypothetical protein
MPLKSKRQVSARSVVPGAGFIEKQSNGLLNPLL